MSRPASDGLDSVRTLGSENLCNKEEILVKTALHKISLKGRAHELVI